jgi:hypothetical protein
MNPVVKKLARQAATLARRERDLAIADADLELIERAVRTASVVAETASLGGRTEGDLRAIARAVERDSNRRVRIRFPGRQPTDLPGQLAEIVEGLKAAAVDVMTRHTRAQQRLAAVRADFARSAVDAIDHDPAIGALIGMAGLIIGDTPEKLIAELRTKLVPEGAPA